MRLRCPVCNNEVDSTALRMEWGAGGGYHCPICNELVRISLPFRLHVALLSLLIAAGTLIIVRVHNTVAFVLLSVLIWVPVSLLLNAVSSRIRPPTLKAVHQRSPYSHHSYELFQKGDSSKAASVPSDSDKGPIHDTKEN